MSIYSERLKEARDLSGLTQKQLADLLGTTIRQYGRYEHGEQEPTISRAAALARALNVSLDYLAGLKDE